MASALSMSTMYPYVTTNILDPSENATFRPLITSGGEFEVPPNEVAMQLH